MRMEAKPLVALIGREKGRSDVRRCFFAAGQSAKLAGLKELLGGPGEARTPDPLVANQVLSQLSYRPTIMFHSDEELAARQQ